MDDNENIVELRSLQILADALRLSNATATASGVDISPEVALQCSAYLACIRVISESVASLPLALYRTLPSGGKEKADGMPLHNILAHAPNSWMTSFEFRELMQAWALMYGVGYAEIKAGKFGSVTELHPLHPTRMTPRRLSNGALRWIYNDPNKTEPRELSQGQVFRVTWMTKDGVNCYAPVAMSREAVALAKATELHSGAFFGNGARPGVVLESAQPLKDETARRLRDTWNDIHSGPTNNSKTAVLPFGITAKVLNESNDAAQLIETRRYQVEEIARSMRVPVYMIGDLTKSSYSSVEQQGLDFVTFTLVPWLRRWEGAIRRDLILDDANYFAEFDVRGLLRGDNAGRSAYYRELWGMGVLSINDIRAAEGMNPVDGGDKRFVPVNMALLESFVVQPPEPEVDPNVVPPAEEPAPAGDAVVRTLFSKALRRCADVEISGILERRGKPPKLAAWIDGCEKRMKTELTDVCDAAGINVTELTTEWMNTTRDELLECHRSGTKYEEVAANWPVRVDEFIRRYFDVQ